MKIKPFKLIFASFLGLLILWTQIFCCCFTSISIAHAEAPVNERVEQNQHMSCHGHVATSDANDVSDEQGQAESHACDCDDERSFFDLVKESQITLANAPSVFIPVDLTQNFTFKFVIDSIQNHSPPEFRSQEKLYLKHSVFLI